MDQLDLVVKMKRGQNTCLYAPALSLFQKRYGFLLGAPFLTKLLVVFCHRVLKNAIFFWKKNVLRFSQETLGKYI